MQLSSQPLVSIVTPVYNTEKYLAECIESIITQTYKNWEYIIVNNCSTDKSLEIAQYYSKKHERIRIHNNNDFLDVIQNVNNAAHQISAESKYCKFVLADDWIFPECIERMVEVAEANPSVGIVGAYRLEENRVTLDGLPYPGNVVSGKEICRLHFINNDPGLYLFGSLSSLLIHSDLMRNQDNFLNESNIHADTEACYKILQSHDFGFVHQVLTFTRRHNESVTSKIRQYNTSIISGLMILIKYGPLFLNDEEYQMLLKRYMEKYYRLLAGDVFKFREKEYWTFHKNKMIELGFPINKLRLFKTSFLVLYNKILDKMKI